MSYQTPDREALLRDQLTRKRKEIADLAALRQGYNRRMMWRAAHLVTGDIEDAQRQAAALEALLDRL